MSTCTKRNFPREPSAGNSPSSSGYLHVAEPGRGDMRPGPGFWLNNHRAPSTQYSIIERQAADSGADQGYRHHDTSDRAQKGPAVVGCEDIRLNNHASPHRQAKNKGGAEGEHAGDGHPAIKYCSGFQALGSFQGQIKPVRLSPVKLHLEIVTQRDGKKKRVA